MVFVVKFKVDDELGWLAGVDAALARHKLALT